MNFICYCGKAISQVLLSFKQINMKYFQTILFLLFINVLVAQDDMMDLFADEEPKIEYTDATFKTTLLVIGQTVENPPKFGVERTVL